MSSQNAFRINDLHLSSLQNIGKLNVSWTAFLDKHLLLAVGTKTLAFVGGFWIHIPNHVSEFPELV